jgi:hypothetical protein
LLLLKVEKVIWQQLVQVATLKVDVEDGMRNLLHEIPWEDLDKLDENNPVRMWFKEEGKLFSY